MGAEFDYVTSAALARLDPSSVGQVGRLGMTKEVGRVGRLVMTKKIIARHV